MKKGFTPGTVVLRVDNASQATVFVRSRAEGVWLRAYSDRPEDAVLTGVAWDAHLVEDLQSGSAMIVFAPEEKGD
jgi:hypothetical protein